MQAADGKRIRITKDGPYLVTGGVPLSKQTIVCDEEQESLKWQQDEPFEDRESCGLCRCGASGRKPFCDGSHSTVNFSGTEVASRETYAENAERIVGPAARLDLAKIGQLTFEAPDFDRFPGLRLAYDALRTGGGATTVFNAANEVAVAAFIAGKIRFGAIARLVEATIEAWIRSGNLAPLTSADDAIAVDHNARNKAATLLPQIALKAS